MPISVTYLYTAVQCPPIQVPAATVNPLAGGTTPPVATAILSSDSIGLVDKLNEHATRADLAAMCGAPCFCVGGGLALTDGGGMVGGIDVGYGLSGGYVPVPSPLALALVDGRQHVWLSALGDKSIRTDLVAPSPGSWAYLGSIKTAAAAVTELDYSGRVEWRGALFRRTADAGAPSDTPPSGLFLYTRTAGGIYVWDGSTHTQIG